MTGNPFYRFASLLGLLIACTPVTAAVRTFTATGTVTQVTDPAGVLGGVVLLADPFSAIYSYDTSVPDQFPSDARIGRYFLIPPLEVTTGPLSLTSNGTMYLNIINNTLGDAYSVVSQFSTSTVFIKELNLLLSGSIAFHNDLLPTNAPDLGQFLNRTFLIQGQALTGGPDFVISGTLTGITPEPTAFLMMLVASAVIACRRANK